MKRVVLLGSSGGGRGALSTSSLSDTRIVTTLRDSLHGMSLVYVQYVLCMEGMDIAKNEPLKHQASLISLSTDSEQLFHVGPELLDQINRRASDIDKTIAKAISAGEIDAVIVISCDPDGVNQKSLAAAIAHNIPIIG